ncbi:hypothetical protein SAMN04489732_1184 [Amycolatopsis saalfeldensis]|uniref:CDP-Glycerol:Poly(Glycerophosphate) glycerophosphotransferase n=1 Tax=Amycolatopsis saalfeldensis TaxID=394193 RepID=A0A1H8YIN4_9PSEU|nr:hypothetical protein SAMN04489732_1184 [Amycolatopsis saalfeldensis]
MHHGSEFGDGVEALLSRAGARLYPWDKIASSGYVLTLTASENIGFTSLSGPVLVFQHGVGFHKYVPDSESSGDRLSGLVPEAALKSGQVRMAISHPSQEVQLRAANPATAGTTVLIGDSQFEQLLDSAGHRGHYRRILGLGDRRFVLLSSTWKKGSLFGTRPHLPTETLAAMPHDETAVGLVLHPNIWSKYGPLQLRAWYDGARKAGLLLFPPELGWQAALIAADLVVGDHGSVSLLAAAVGKPVLLAASGDEVVPGTSAELLCEQATRLRRDQPLRPQLEAAGSQPWQELLAERTFAHAQTAISRLHALVYETLGLSPRPAPQLRAADPETRPSPVLAFTTYPDLTGADAITLHRFPRAVEQWKPEPGRAPADLLHTVVDERETNVGRIGEALVLVRSTVDNEPEQWCRATLRRYPRCELAAAATRDGCVAIAPDGEAVTATGTADTAALASTLYACRGTTDRTVSLRLGRAVTTVVIRH